MFRAHDAEAPRAERSRVSFGCDTPSTIGRWAQNRVAQYTAPSYGKDGTLAQGER